MIDSFITYDSNGDASESPGYLSKLRAEMFRHNSSMEAQNFGFRQPQDLQFMVEMMPRDHNFEAFSHTSAYSNPSTKDSPDHTPDDEDHSLEDDKGQFSKVPPIVRKGIRKYYEPIVDNNVVYKYEDDPNEYRKARKRIQNRESATRVRNRKKNHVEILEDEITGLKQQNAELKAQNSSLVAENNMLKKKIVLLEKTVSRNNPGSMIEISEHRSHQLRHEADSILQFGGEMSKIDEDLETNQMHQMSVEGNKFIRAAPNHKFKRHMALLGVFTLLLCVYGLLPKTEAGTVQLFASPRNIFSSKGNTVPLESSNKTLSNQTSSNYTDLDHSPNNDNLTRQEDKFEPLENNKRTENKFEPFQGGHRRRRGDKNGKMMHPPPKGHRNRFKRFEESNNGPYTFTISIYTALEILVVLCYSLYLIYVGVSAYKLHVQKKRQSRQPVASRPLSL